MLAHSTALGASALANELVVDLEDVVSLADEAAAGVPAGPALARFARAVLGPDDLELDAARKSLLAEVSERGVGDAACVVAGFDSVNRVADATGVQVPEMWEQAAASIAPAVDFDRFRTEV